jgi:hypothetical protein
MHIGQVRDPQAIVARIEPADRHVALGHHCANGHWEKG